MIEAMKQALEALEIYWSKAEHRRTNEDEYKATAAITSLRTAIAEAEKQEVSQEPVVGTKTWVEDGKVVTQNLYASDIYKDPPQHQQEPVAWKTDDIELYVREDKFGFYNIPLYTHPPKHEPCPFVVSTSEGTHHCSLSHREPLTDEQIQQLVLTAHGNQDWTLVFARAIEAAHNIFGEKK